MSKKIEDFLQQSSENICRIPFKFKDKYEIKPITVAQMIRLNPKIVSIAKDDLDDLQLKIEQGRISDFAVFFDKYGKTITEIVEIILDQKIPDDFTADDLLTLFVAILYRLNTKSFLNSINLIQRLSLQKRSEIIAAEKRYMTLPDF